MNFRNIYKLALSSLMAVTVCSTLITVHAEDDTAGETPAPTETTENKTTANAAKVLPFMLNNAKGFKEPDVLEVSADVDVTDLAAYLNAKQEIEEFEGMSRVVWDGESTQEEGKNYILTLMPHIADMHGHHFAFGEYYEDIDVVITCTVGDVFEEGQTVQVVHTKEDGTVADTFETEVTDGVIVIHNTKGFSTFTVTPVDEEPEPEPTPDVKPEPTPAPAPAPSEPSADGRKPATNTGVK